MRARNEPMVGDAKEKTRSDQTKRRAARAQNEPAGEPNPPNCSPEGSHGGSSGDQITTARPRAMVKMMRADDDGPPRARPREPWWHPPFHVPPTGTTDRWQVVENFVVRVHRKMRYQRRHPIHSSYPLRDEQVLTGSRVTIKYIGVGATLDKEAVTNLSLQRHRPLHRLQACSMRQSVPVEC